jgi:transposase
LSQWLHAGVVKAGLSVELIETRHVRAAFKTMPVKTDKKDARGIAQLMRLGWSDRSTANLLPPRRFARC